MMKKSSIIILATITLLAFANEETSKAKMYCLGVDGQKVPLGTKWVFTCNTDPNTKENVWYRYCFIDKDGKARWSKSYTGYSPEGC